LGDRLIKWIIFGVVLGLVPLVAKVFWIKLTGEPSLFSYSREQSLNWLELASYKGELLLLAAGLSAAGIGDLFSSGPFDPPWKRAKILILGFCLCNLIVGCMLYALLSELYQEVGVDQIATVALFSFVSYIGAVGASALCVALAGEPQQPG
jgi:hypothetical protein